VKSTRELAQGDIAHVSEPVISVEPAELYVYAKRGRLLSDQLAVSARRLARALQFFATTCSGASAVASPGLADKLQRYCDDLFTHDDWVRDVGEAFERAARGQPLPATQTIDSFSSAREPNAGASGERAGTVVTPDGTAGGTTGLTGSDDRTVVGKPGGGATRVVPAVGYSPEPPADAEPDLPADTPSFDVPDELWTQADVPGTFLLVYANDRLRALRGGSWVCGPGGPVPAVPPASGIAGDTSASDYHFEATRQGNLVVGEIQICWHNGDSPPHWAPAPLQVTFSANGDRLTGRWDDQVHHQSNNVDLSRVVVPPLTSDDFGLPPTNLRIYDYGVLKVQRLDGTIANVVENYMFDPELDEQIVRHGGIDFTSRDDKWLVARLTFATPVGGVVELYPNSTWSTIGLRLDTGDWLQFLHASEIAVGTGQRVEAGAVLGKTGAIGTTTIHLHVQARSADGTTLSPDAVVNRARRLA
jgi:hypothetical protein